MIEFHDTDHFLKVLEFAVQANATKELADKLKYLSDYGGGGNMCRLFRDWAPNSFTFNITKPDGQFWFNGGLIYSGPGQPLDGSAPALTVSLGADTGKHNWSVHT